MTLVDFLERHEASYPEWTYLSLYNFVNMESKSLEEKGIVEMEQRIKNRKIFIKKEKAFLNILNSYLSLMSQRKFCQKYNLVAQTVRGFIRANKDELKLKKAITFQGKNVKINEESFLRELINKGFIKKELKDD